MLRLSRARKTTFQPPKHLHFCGRWRVHKKEGEAQMFPSPGFGLLTGIGAGRSWKGVSFSRDPESHTALGWIGSPEDSRPPGVVSETLFGK